MLSCAKYMKKLVPISKIFCNFVPITELERNRSNKVVWDRNCITE